MENMHIVLRVLTIQFKEFTYVGRKEQPFNQLEHAKSS